MPNFPAAHLDALTDLLSILTASDKPVAERRQSAIALLESLTREQGQPRRRPFWKR